MRRSSSGVQQWSMSGHEPLLHFGSGPSGQPRGRGDFSQHSGGRFFPLEQFGPSGLRLLYATTAVAPPVAARPVPAAILAALSRKALYSRLRSILDCTLVSCIAAPVLARSPVVVLATVGADWTKGFAITLVPPAKNLKMTLPAATAPRLPRDKAVRNLRIRRRSARDQAFWPLGLKTPARDSAFPSSRRGSVLLAEVISFTT